MQIPVLPLLNLVGIVIKDAPGGISADEWSEIGLQLVVVGEAAFGLSDVSGPVIDGASAAAHVAKVIRKHGANLHPDKVNVLGELAGLFHKAAA